MWRYRTEEQHALVCISCRSCTVQASILTATVPGTRPGAMRRGPTRAAVSRGGASRQVGGVASLRGLPSGLRCRATSPGWRPTHKRWWAASTEAGRGAGAGPAATRWQCAPASSQRAGVMTSWSPTKLSMPLGRRWASARSVGGHASWENDGNYPRPAVSALWRGQITRSAPWPGAFPCSFWPRLRPSP